MPAATFERPKLLYTGVGFTMKRLLMGLLGLGLVLGTVSTTFAQNGSGKHGKRHGGGGGHKRGTGTRTAPSK